ncbi:uncharacterized protein [Miscanthus floridulus]|uniref:uncharacterized protein n=1 Tax=Miscanthus floridulus TaxID=154761 RepID=UPI00345873DF
MEQVMELLDLIKGVELRGELVAASFIVRRIQPCKERAHPAFNYKVGHKEQRPSTAPIRLLREEVVVVEEENTTREIKRLKSTVAGVMTQIEGIARTAKQRHQLMKRMEPLAEENKKLREALNLLEKSIKRAQREWDLAESNSQDLEHQKVVLSEQLTAASKQLKKKSEQLSIVTEELKNMSEQLSKKTGELKKQDAELSQLRQTVEQIRQDKVKELERANKLAKELKDYRHKAKAQFDVLVQEAKVQKDNFNTVTAVIKPVLDCVDIEPAPCPDGRQQGLDTIIQRCKAAWENFKNFNRDAVMTAATHALVVVRSHYPSVDIQLIGGGFAKGLSDVETQQLEDDVEDAAKMLVGDIDLFGKTEGVGEA